MIMLRRPTDSCLRQFLNRHAVAGFSYPQVGQTACDNYPADFDHDQNRIRLGDGVSVFEKACTALRCWRQFPATWTHIFPDDVPLRVGTTVAMTAHVFGLWWINTCRIVYLVDETTPRATDPIRRFGFAYGTLHEHVESGEERFLIEQLADGSVWYDLCSFSRPRLWCARLAYPLVRHLQRRFVRDSQRAMQIAVKHFQ